MPKLSVVIPVYNADSFLKQTLDSVLSQSLKDIEVICVDNGSTDASVDLVANYCKKDSRVKQLFCPEGNAGTARNFGLQKATGEFIHFLDADDYVLNYAYEALCNKMSKYNLDCIKFCALPYDMQLQETVFNLNYSLSNLLPEDFNRLFTKRANEKHFELSVAPWTGMYRRSFLINHQISFNDLVCVNDRSFFWRVVLNAPRIMAARDTLVVHRTNMSESLVGRRAYHFDCHFSSLLIIERQMIADGISEEIIEKVIREELQDIIYWCQKFSVIPDLGQQIIESTQKFFASLNYSFIWEYQLKVADILDLSTKKKNKNANKVKPTPYRYFHLAHTKPKISIIVPFSNHEDYLNETLFSLVNQSLEEIEILCINYGSADGSMVIVREYAEIDKRIKVIDKPNTGFGHAINIGLKKATGQYLGILYPTDYIIPETCEDLYRIASKFKLDFVQTNFNSFTIAESGAILTRLVRLTADSELYNRVVTPLKEIESFPVLKKAWSGIYKTTFLKEHNICLDESSKMFSQESTFWFQTFCQATRARFLKKPYYMNRVCGSDASEYDRSDFFSSANEYDYIYKWLESNPSLLERTKPAFWQNKFENSMMTYFGLSADLKKEYLHHIRNEYVELVETGIICKDYFSLGAWRQLKGILENPDVYFEGVKVTVVVYVDNLVKNINQTLDFLLAHNDIRIEIICIDGGASENCLKCLCEYENKDSRIRVIPQEKSTPAKITGIKHAKGEYVLFLDTNSFFDVSVLRVAYNEAANHDADILVLESDLYLDANQKYVNTPYSIKKNLLPCKEPFASRDIRKNLFEAFNGWTGDKLFKSEFLRSNELIFQERETADDFSFISSALVCANRIATYEPALIHRRYYDANQWSKGEDDWHHFYRALISLREKLIEWDKFDCLKRDFVNYALSLILLNLHSSVGDSYHRLYKMLKNGWFDELGISEEHKSSFYNRNEYEQYELIMKSTSEEYLFWRLNESRVLLFDIQEQLAFAQKEANALQKKINKVIKVENKLKKRASVQDHARSSRMKKVLNRIRRTFKVFF